MHPLHCKICILIIQIIAVAPHERDRLFEPLSQWVDSRMPCKYDKMAERSVCPAIGPTDWFIGVDVIAAHTDHLYLGPYAIYRQIFRPFLLHWLNVTRSTIKFGPNSHRMSILFNNVTVNDVNLYRPDLIDCKKKIIRNLNEFNLDDHGNRHSFRPGTYAPIMEVVRLHVQKCAKMDKQRVIILLTYTPTATSFQVMMTHLRLLYMSPQIHRPPTFFMVHSGPYSHRAQFELERPFENTAVNGSLYIPCDSKLCAPVDRNRWKLLAAFFSRCVCSESEDCAYERKDNWTTVRQCHFLTDEGGHVRCAAIVKPKFTFEPNKRLRNPWSKRCSNMKFDECDRKICVASCDSTYDWGPWTECAFINNSFYARYRQRISSSGKTFVEASRFCPNISQEYCDLPRRVQTSTTTTIAMAPTITWPPSQEPANITDTDIYLTDTTTEELIDDDYKDRVSILTWILVVLSVVLIVVVAFSYVMIRRERIKNERYRKYRRHRKKKDSRSSLTLLPVTLSPTSSKTKTSADDGGTTGTKTSTKKTKKTKSSSR